MMVCITIAWNDLRVFLKDRGGYVWLFVMPMVFILFFGFAMRGDQAEPSNPRPSVGIRNRDEGYLGSVFVELLETEGIRVVPSDAPQEAKRQIEIPQDFTERVEAVEAVDVAFLRQADSAAEPAAMVEVRIARAIVALTSAIVGTVTEDGSPSEEGIRDALRRPDRVRLATRFAGRRAAPSGFEQSVPGYAVMFVFMNVMIFGALSISAERHNGVLRRIAVQPLSRWQWVVGKIAGRFLLGMVQIVSILAFGWLACGLRYGGNLLMVAATLTLFAWGSAALGVFVGAVIRDAEVSQGVCTLTAIVMAALGGCWWPLEIVPESIRRIGYLTPTSWAMEALHQLISFGGGPGDVVVELLLIAGFACVCTLLAARTLRVV